MTRKHITVFPDTNILLHYPPIKNVDWKTLCDAYSVKIVICMQVIDELDDKKYDSRLGGPAVTAQREIEDLMNSGLPVMDNVNIELYKVDIEIVSGDKLIVEQVLDYKSKNRDDIVAIYSDDLGMSLRCKPHNIEVIKPDRNMRQPLPQSELEKKYKTAVAKISELESKSPVLEVFLTKTDVDSDKDTPFTVELSKVVEVINWEELYQQEERRIDQNYLHPTMYDENDIKKYYREVKEYLPKYKEWISVQNVANDEKARQFIFYVVINNIGKVPADDIECYLSLPHFIKYITDENHLIGDFHHYPEKPSPPTPPRAKHQKRFMPSASIAQSIFGTSRTQVMVPALPTNQLILPSKKESTKIYKDDHDGFKIHMYIPKIKHLYNRIFGPFKTGFKSWEDVHPFDIKYEIHVENLPDRVEGKILVKAGLSSSR